MSVTPGATVAVPRDDLLGAWYEINPDEPIWAAPRILPAFTVNKTRGSIGVVPREAMTALVNTKRRPKDPSKTNDWDPESQDFRLVEYSFKEFVPRPQSRDFAEWFDLEALAVQRCKLTIMRDYERDVATALFNTTQFPQSGNTGVDVNPNWDNASGVPVTDVATAITALENEYGTSGFRMALTSAAKRKLMLNAQVLTKITDAIGPVKPAAITDQQLAVALGLDGIDEIFANGNVYNGAKPGQAFSGSKLWTDDYALVHKPGMGRDLSMPQLGRTFGLAGEEDVVIESWEENDPKGTWVKCSMVRAHKLSPSPVGFLFTDLLT